METLSFWTYQLSKKILALLFGIMTIVIIAQVICRTFFGFSFFWAEELARYLFAWVTFVGASIGLKKGDLVAMDLIQNKIKDEFQLFYQLVIQLIILSFVCVAFYFGIKQIFTPTVLNSVSSAMQLPMPFIYASVPIGFGFMLIHILDILLGIILRREVPKSEV